MKWSAEIIFIIIIIYLFFLETLFTSAGFSLWRVGDQPF